MGMLDDWAQVKNDENNNNGKRFALTNNAPKMALAGSTYASGGPNTMPQDQLDEIVRRNTLPYQRSSNQEMFNPNGTRQGADDNIVNEPQQKSILDSLYDQMMTPYKRPDASQYDFSPIDNALNSRLGLIDQLKTSAQNNFQRSDQNTQDMHNQFVNQMNTEGVANVNKIADTQKSNLTNDSNAGIAQLNQQKAADMQARTDMLNKLGIQAAGGAVDPGTETLDRGISTIAQRGAADQTLADNNRASNMALNSSEAAAMGAAGVQRREMLQNQLQAIMGKADIAKMDAQGSAAQQKASMLNDAQGVAFNAYKDQQSRAQNLFDTLTRDRTQNNRYNMQYGPNSRYQTGKGPVTPGGYQQISNDLANAGVDEDEAAQGMKALDDVLNSGNYLSSVQDPNVDRAAVLAQKIGAITHNPHVAAQIALNYGKTATLK